MPMPLELKRGFALLVPNVRGSKGYGRTFSELDNGILREDAVKDIGALLDWVEKRLPVMNAYKKHLSEYPMPKNFNFWYSWAIGIVQFHAKMTCIHAQYHEKFCFKFRTHAKFRAKKNYLFRKNAQFRAKLVSY